RTCVLLESCARNPKTKPVQHNPHLPNPRLPSPHLSWAGCDLAGAGCLVTFFAGILCWHFLRAGKRRGFMNRARALGIGAAVLLALAVIGFFTVLPAWIDRHMNRLAPNPPPPATGAAAALHQRLNVVDLHADPLLWKRNLVTSRGRGHIDLERLQQGNVALQVFSSVTKIPRGINYERNRSDSDQLPLLAIAQLQPASTWRSLLHRSLFHAEKLHRFEEESEGRLRIIRTVQDLDALLADRAA